MQFSGAPAHDPALTNRRIPIDFIIALLALMGILVGLAVYTSSENQQIEQDNTLLSLAARQRMLVEREAKLMYRVGVGFNSNNPIDTAESLRSLKRTHQIFGDTLGVFSNGGEVEDPVTGEVVTVAPVTTEEATKTLGRLEQLFASYSARLNVLFNTRLSRLNQSIITNSADATQEVNEPLLSLSTNLVQHLETELQTRQNSLGFAQRLSFILGLILLAYLAVRVIRNLKNSGEELQSNLNQLQVSNSDLASAQSSLAQNASDLQTAYNNLQSYSKQIEETSAQLFQQQEESESIFSTVREGLCLIDSEGRIGNQVSDEMFDIFETESLTGRNLLDLLRPLLTEKDLRSLSSYLDLQFDPTTSDTQLDKFNPLEKVEITLASSDGGFVTKNLSFLFQRIFTESDQVSSVLVTVNDATETARLENELNRARDDRERQTALILEIVESDPKELDIFVKKAESTLDEINDELVNSNITSEADAGSKLVESVFNKIHNIKGNASLLRLQSVVELAGQVEEQLIPLRRKDKISGEELLAAIVNLAQIREVLTEIEELRASTLSGFTGRSSAGSSSSEKPTRTSVLVNELRGLTALIGSKKGNSASISSDHLSLDPLSGPKFQLTKDLLVQMVRNSMVHGIEDRKTRMEANKWEEGTIHISSEIKEADDNPLGTRCFVLRYRDDGRGIDPEKIGRRGVELELLTQEEFEKASSAVRSALIFEHGFSSVDVSDDHAGRGTGMGLIRSIVNTELKGKLRMLYETGDYLEFTVFIPLGDESNDAIDITDNTKS